MSIWSFLRTLVGAGASPPELMPLDAAPTVTCSEPRRRPPVSSDMALLPTPVLHLPAHVRAARMYAISHRADVTTEFRIIGRDRFGPGHSVLVWKDDSVLSIAVATPVADDIVDVLRHAGFKLVGDCWTWRPPPCIRAATPIATTPDVPGDNHHCKDVS